MHRSKELRVPESLIKETLRQMTPTCLQYLERLSLSKQHFETLSTILYIFGAEVIATVLPMWRTFSAEDDISLAYRFLLRHTPPFPQHSPSKAERNWEETDADTVTLNNAALHSLNTFTDAEKERLCYLLAPPGSAGFSLTIPKGKVTRDQVEQWTHGRIAALAR